jgi:RNA polymerase sigma-70 factor (ECF subfamily)
MGITQKVAGTAEASLGFNRVKEQTFERDDRGLDLLESLNFSDSVGREAAQQQLNTAVGEQILALYDEYRPRLFRYLRSMSLSRDQAEEVIQETFMRLTTQLLREEVFDNLQGWVVRVAHNFAVDVLKRKNRDSAGDADLTFAIENRVDPTPNPEEEYSKKEQIRQMQTALSLFNEQQRRCFHLRAQGFRYKDIGMALGISEQRAAFIVKQVAVRLAAICG